MAKQTIEIVAHDGEGRVAILYVETDAEWLFTDRRDAGRKTFKPVKISEIKVGTPERTFAQLTDINPFKSRITNHA